MRKSQVSIEYIIVVGFVTVILIGILGIAFFYSGTIKDNIKIAQVTNFANKLTSTAESVFYAGKPSKATITSYLPDGVKQIDILENTLFFTIQTNSGITKISFTSSVPISGNLNSGQGVKKIKIVAEEDRAVISPA